MAMRREVSLGVGLATAALAYGVYSKALPNVADVRVSEPGDAHLSSTERGAAWTATAIVAAVSLLSKDATVFVIGGATIVILSWTHRHANTVNPMGGSSVQPSSRQLMNDSMYANTGPGYVPA